MTIGNPAQPQDRRARLDEASSGGLPDPWRLIGYVNVGGLTDVGFVIDSDSLLVVSHDGRGMVDCLAAQTTERDPDPNHYFDLEGPRAFALTPFADQLVRLAGLHGDSLPTATADGWRVERYAELWPREQVFLLPPGYDPDHSVAAAAQPAQFDHFASEVRAFGFSPTGRSLVMATSSDITIIGRPSVG